MNKFIEKIKDIIYDSFDYVVMTVIVITVVAIIGWRLDVLFATDVDVTPGTPIIVDNSSKENPDDVHNDDIVPENPGEAPVDETPSTEVPEVPVVPVDVPAPTPTGEKIKIVIPAGSLPGKIGSLLADSGLIESSKDFISKAVELKLDTKLKSGTYSIPKGTSYEDILKILTK